MSNTGSKKLLTFYVYEILRRYSDYDHKLSQTEISHLIRKVYGMECDRKAVGRNISVLIDAGMDIETYEENREGFYLRDPLFSNAEVRMLIDSVLASRYITGAYACDLAARLAQLATVHFTHRIPLVSQADRWIHTDNPQVFLNIELLDQAIASERQVAFIYNRYDLQKKLRPRQDKKYIVDPYQIACNGGRYYLVGNYDRHDCITNFRVDLITEVEVLECPIIPFQQLSNRGNALDIADYMCNAINMYDGERVFAVLRLHEERIGDVIDWFGKDITVLPRVVEDGERQVRIRVTGSDNGIRIWAIQYGRIAEVLSPEHLRQSIANDVAEIASKYGVKREVV